jgi:mannose-1-phosphate guanylyltransferase
MINILLCGGSGTRLWPISREMTPKQFNKFFEGESLFQKTVSRNSSICNGFKIVAGLDQYFMAMDQIDELDKSIKADYILEPVARNTAPAIALAIKDLPEDEIVLITPSDHLIKDLPAYINACARAKELAELGNLVTFGITPTYPETGYGYIKHNQEDVEKFVEKPNFETAESYINSGNYLWNSGMFCFKVKTFMSELNIYRPELFSACQIELKQNGNIFRIDRDEMLNIPSDSIDFAVMEQSKIVKVIPSSLGWSDVGSFDSLYNELEKDENGNTKSDNLISLGSKNNLIKTKNKLVTTIDVEDLIIVDTTDALLIAKRGSSQKVKEIVAKVKDYNAELTKIHTTGYRPWGSYTIINEDIGYKVKRIKVKPHAKLSLQRHKHRNEHWVVVKGKAIVTNGDNVFELKENQSTYIAAGEVHRLENKTDDLLTLIEVQVGSYVGEDDIERLQDDYART